MRFLPLLLLPLCLTYSCTNDKKTTQTTTANGSDGDEIDPYSNVVFTFDGPVVDEAQQNRWDTTRYVQFEPAVRGKFKWTGDRELTFSPAEPFRPSTVFAAQVRAGALPTGKQGAALDRTKFHTPYLQMSDPQVFYGRSERAAGTTELRANLVFNYPVRPADLAGRLKLTQDGQEVPATVVATETDKIIGLTLPGSVRTDMPLNVAIAPGLRPAAGRKATTETLRAVAQVPEPTTLDVRELTGSLIDGQPVVTVLTTQPLTTEAVTANLSVEPATTFKVEALESGFSLKGGFEVGKNYQITLNEGTKGLLGGALEHKFSQAVSFGDEAPSISFASAEKAMYLSAVGSRSLALRINAVPKVKITIAKIYANNIQAVLRAGTEYGYNYEEGEENQDEDGNYIDRSYRYYNVENTGNILSERTVSVAGLTKQNGLRVLRLDLKELEFQGAMKGLYVVTVADPDHQYLQVSKLVALTDVGLMVKQGATGGTVVFANSIRTAEPLKGVTVNLVSSNNQVLQTATTDGSGVAAFDSAASMKRFSLGMVTATKDADFSFLSMSKSRVETSRFEVGGLTMNAAHYQAFLYGDRDLYRPGDTIFTNTVVRTDDWQTPNAGLPMKIRLLLPTGKEYAALQTKLDRAGAFHNQFVLPGGIITGLYTLEVLTGNDVLLTSRQISVEEFVPDRMKVTVTATPATVPPGSTVTAAVTAVNLFGPPAADRKFEVQFSLKPKPFNPKKFPDYNFTIGNGQSYGSDALNMLAQFEAPVREGTTDAAGQGSVTYDVPDTRDLGTLAGTAFATVFDETGRPVNRLATFEVPTQAVLFGIGNLNGLVNTRQALPIRLVALTPTEKPTTASADVRIVRLLWETVLERQGGRFVYNSQRREQTIFSRNMEVSNGTEFKFTPLYSGEYAVRVSRPGAATFVTETFYAYGYGDTANNAFEVNNEGEVTIEADKAKYEPGETAKLLLKTPFAGRVLVTVERGQVLDHFYVSTDQKSAEIKIPIKGDHVPNIYVTATAIRPITDNRLPLTVARGFVPLTVEKPGAHLTCAISTPAKTRSQRWQTVEVTTAPNAQVTLALVDEGILQLKDYHTPDPFGYFYQKRALEVGSFDVYPFLLPELGTSSTGGDASEMSRRTTPVPTRRIKLLAKWSGPLTADGNGKVRYKWYVPQFSGAVRVMAAAYKDDAFGSAETTVKVADPVVISTALPRFMSPGDTIDVPVTLTNTTSKNASGTAALTVSGPLLMLGAASQTVALAPNAERRVVFRALAPAAVGAAQLRTTVSALGEQFTETIDLPVRPASPLEKCTGSGEITGGQSAPLNLKTDFFPASQRSQLVLSRSPLTEFSKDLRYLLQYPYGCLEQTVSAAFPQLYYGDLAATLQNKVLSTQYPVLSTRYNANDNVQQAIRKIESLQLYNGSLSYWPGGDYDNWWATAYAAHFLQEAQRAGFAVNKKVLDKVLDYLLFRLRKRETEKYQYFDVNNIAREKTIASKEIAYSLYVLGLAGRQDATAMSYYRANRDLLAEDSRYLLACTQGLLGNQRLFRTLLPTSFGSDRPVSRELGGSFYSPIRDEALVLNALLATDPNNPQVLTLGRQLSRQMKQAGWLNTQERAFGLLALGKIARRNAGSTATATVLAGSQPLGQFSGKDATIGNVANRQLLLKTLGQGKLYYFWQVEGISPNTPVREEDAYLKVRRQFLTRTGQPVGRPSFRQNDLVVVRVSIESAAAAGEVKNVAITDLLPAGLEIENSRLGAVPELRWITNAATPDYLDIRDDRINFFTTAEPGTKYFYYLARAVSKGSFKLGPVSADAMYNAEYHSYNGAGVVTVR